MINITFILAFISAAVGIIVGIMIFSAVSVAVPCPGDGANADGTDDNTVQGYTECNNGKTTAWTVIGILPITLFFVLFQIFGTGGKD